MTVPEPERQLVLFSLHGEQYALPITSVREIIRYTAPTATAAASGLVQGMIAQRGRVLPVVDLSDSLGRAPRISPSTRILVVELSNGELGLIVDTVEGVVTVPADHVSRVPVSVAHEGLGEEVATVDDRLVILIDPERVLGGFLVGPKPRRRSPATRTKRPTGTKPPTGTKRPSRTRPASGDAG